MNRDFGTRGGRPNEWDPQKKPRTHWEGAPAENAAFEEYYKTQGICPEEEWNDFMTSLRRQLPLTFRINGGGKFAEELRGKLETDFFAGFASGSGGDGDGESITPPLPLPWYPNKLAWQLDFTRTQLRKIDRLKALHEFMKRESDVGSITRQEAVSMVPPLFMDVQSHHRVLDMCAAPGSKTAQLLEALHSCSGEPSGVVVANDADVQRCNMLTHQTQRIRSPAMIITNHEAQRFPLLWDLNPESSDQRVLFDRILCDVPCSGDGTLRKQPDIWRKWNPANGNGLHIIQLRITLRACELLRTGGRLVYSTCSFNPVEDEAVVAEVLRRTHGSMVLLDVSSELPELKRQPGLRRWKVKDGSKWCDTWEDSETGKLGATLFPGPDDEDLPLERCMRFLPHHQNTGGFFVAVLQKVSPITNLKYPQSMSQSKTTDPEPNSTVQADDQTSNDVIAGEEQKATADDMNETTAKPATRPPPKGLPAWGVRGGGSRNRESGSLKEKEGEDRGEDQGEGEKGRTSKQQGGKWKGIDPVVPFIDAGNLSAIQEFYGLASDCPVLCDSLIARSHDPRPKKLSYLNPGAKLLLRMDVHEQIKVTAAGLKVFERQDTKDVLLSCFYRIAQEGLPYILPYLTRQKFHPTVKELLHILEDRVVSLPAQCKVHITKWKSQPASATEETNIDEATHGENQADKSNAHTNSAADNEKNENGNETAVVTLETKSKTDPRFELEDSLTLEQLAQVEYGCCVAILRDEDVANLGLLAQAGSQTPVTVACWRGRGSLNVLMSKQECEQMADRLKVAMTDRKV